MGKVIVSMHLSLLPPLSAAILIFSAIPVVFIGSPAIGSESIEHPDTNSGPNNPHSLPHASASTDPLKDKWIIYIDTLVLHNPLGVVGLAGALFQRPYRFSPRYEAVSASIQAGAEVGLNPAYAQMAAHVEWMPWIVALIRLQYDFYAFFGANGALLSFATHTQAFGDDAINERSGDEEPSVGHRVKLSPTLRAKLGPLVIRNTIDFAGYSFYGRGPYFYEWEFDTLLDQNDGVFNERLNLLLELWSKGQAATFLVGPVYELTYAVKTQIRRQRAGVQVLWIPRDQLGGWGQFRIYLQTGVNIEDRNRKNQIYAIIGAGTDWEL